MDKLIQSIIDTLSITVTTSPLDIEKVERLTHILNTLQNTQMGSNYIKEQVALGIAEGMKQLTGLMGGK